MSSTIQYVAWKDLLHTLDEAWSILTSQSCIAWNTGTRSKIFTAGHEIDTVSWTWVVDTRFGEYLKVLCLQLMDWTCYLYRFYDLVSHHRTCTWSNGKFEWAVGKDIRISRSFH